MRGTGGQDAGVLRIDFPGGSGEESLEPISWDEWFEKFEENRLAFLYQDRRRAARTARSSSSSAATDPESRRGRRCPVRSGTERSPSVGHRAGQDVHGDRAQDGALPRAPSERRRAIEHRHFSSRDRREVPTRSRQGLRGRAGEYVVLPTTRSRRPTAPSARRSSSRSSCRRRRSTPSSTTSRTTSAPQKGAEDATAAARRAREGRARRDRPRLAAPPRAAGQRAPGRRRAADAGHALRRRDRRPQATLDVDEPKKAAGEEGGRHGGALVDSLTDDFKPGVQGHLPRARAEGSSRRRRARRSRSPSRSPRRPDDLAGALRPP